MIDQNREQIRNTSLNYIEGWFEGNFSRVEQALHPDLIKRRFIPNKKTWRVDTPWMIEATKKGQGILSGFDRKSCIVEILDIHANIASVKIISPIYIDFLHLVKLNGKWRIVDALWDFASEESEKKFLSRK